MDKKKKNFIKSLKYGGLLFLAVMLIGSMYTAQAIGEFCEYDPFLGPVFYIKGKPYYPPGIYWWWCFNSDIYTIIPDVLAKYKPWMSRFRSAAIVLVVILIYFMNKNAVKLADAKWADSDDIEKMGLGKYNYKTVLIPLWEKITLLRFLRYIPFLKHLKGKKEIKSPKKTGVVLGLNPYTKKLMLHDGPEHILLMAPTRSGKGVSTIIPTGCIWNHSMFFFDPKGELWQLTANYRKKVLGQKVLKFEPLCLDGSSARWNPFAEINIRTFAEFKDAQSIVNILVKPDGDTGGGKDPFWDDAASELLACCILHLMYAHEREKLQIPCLSDMMSLLSPPDKDIDDLFTEIKRYPHISEEEFFSDNNPFEIIYGDRYVKDLNLFNKHWKIDKDEKKIRCMKDLKRELKARYPEGKRIPWDKDPFWIALVHPKVAEGAANMVNLNETTRASLIKTTQTKLSLYQNPIVQKNTCVSDFCVRDLLAHPDQAVSLYLVMQSDDIDTVKPLSRLLISLMLAKNTRDMNVNDSGSKGKQRLLLMLDEFPQLGGMPKIETNMAICAGYGIKYCIVCQDVNQLNKAYTENNSIATNCHIHVYFTPNVDPSGKTAKAISETLGKFEFQSESKSTGQGGLFGGSSTYSKSTRDLMSPDDVARLPRDEEIIFVAGQYPIRGRKIAYYDEASVCGTFFTSRTKMGCPAFSDVVTEIHNFDQLHDFHKAEIEYINRSIKAVEEARAEAMKELTSIKNLDALTRQQTSDAGNVANLLKKADVSDVNLSNYKDDESSDEGKKEQDQEALDSFFSNFNKDEVG